MLVRPPLLWGAALAVCAASVYRYCHVSVGQPMSEHRSPQPRADRTVLPSPTALNSWNAFGLLIRDTIYSMALDALLPHLPSVPPIIQRQSYVVGDSVGSYPALHVICVHGFRGDHTSFRRFPTDLHYSLDDRIPSLHTYIYPTYKSRKPLQVSVERLMTWMDTLEPGYFILVGHSLGEYNDLRDGWRNVLTYASQAGSLWQRLRCNTPAGVRKAQ